MLEWNAFQVRIEADENHLAAVPHHDVMIAIFLILLVITLVLILIALHPQQRAVDELSAVDPPAHGAVTMARFQRLVMRKAFELQINRLPHRQLLGMLVLQLAARVVRPQLLEARRAVAVVFAPSTPRQSAGKGHCLAVRAYATAIALSTNMFEPSMRAYCAAAALATVLFLTAMRAY